MSKKKLKWARRGLGKVPGRIWSALSALVLVTALITLGGAAAASTAAACNPADEYTPCISVQPTSAAPGQSVTITGTGYAALPADYEIPITFGFTPQGDLIAYPVESSTGTFTVKVTVPTDAPIGATTIETFFGEGSDAVTIPFTVTSTPTPSCPSLLFLGAHGVNEGSSSIWGPNMQAVWLAFNKQLPTALGEPVPYGYVPLDLSNLSAEVWQAIGLPQQAKADAQVLETQMYNQFTACGTKTRFVLAGYSFGAWVVDLALRDLNGTVWGKPILAQVAGAGVMGDPAYPGGQFCKKVTSPRGSRTVCRQGVATYFRAGYPTTSEYLNNGLSKNFIGYCLSYSNTQLDPVCGMYSRGDLNAANISLHETGYQTSGLAGSLGGVLAGYAKQ